MLAREPLSAHFASGEVKVCKVRSIVSEYQLITSRILSLFDQNKLMHVQCLRCNVRSSYLEYVHSSILNIKSYNTVFGFCKLPRQSR